MLVADDRARHHLTGIHMCDQRVCHLLYISAGGLWLLIMARRNDSSGLQMTPLPY